VNSRLDSTSGEVPLQRVSPVRLYHQQMINVVREWSRRLEVNITDASQRLAIMKRVRCSCVIPFHKVLQLDVKHGRLKCIKASVEAFFRVLVFPLLAVVAKSA
jgi:hypothetical protein